MDRLARQPHSVVISCEMKLNLDYLLGELWDHLNLVNLHSSNMCKYCLVNDFACSISDSSLHEEAGMPARFRRRNHPPQRRHRQARLSRHSPDPPRRLQVCSRLGKLETVTRSRGVNVNKIAILQGTSTKYSPQRVGLTHVMHDEDVIQVVKK